MAIRHRLTDLSIHPPRLVPHQLVPISPHLRQERPHRTGFICLANDPMDETLTLLIAPKCVGCAVRDVEGDRVGGSRWVEGWDFNSEFFLGFDEEKGDYKIMGLSRWTRKDKLVEVYLLREQTWRRIEVEGHVPFCDGDQVFVKGVIHWIGLSKGEGDDSKYEVITFNVKEERFGRLECPEGVVRFGMCLFAYNGIIAVYTGKLDGWMTSVWVLSEYGV